MLCLLCLPTHNLMEYIILFQAPSQNKHVCFFSLCRMVAFAHGRLSTREGEKIVYGGRCVSVFVREVVAACR